MPFIQKNELFTGSVRELALKHKVFAVVNQKGGVGKTTTSANLGAGLAGLGKRVLAVDIDAQANLSAHLGYVADENADRPSMYEVLRDGEKIENIVIPVDENLWLAPGGLLLSAADLELGGVIGREQLLRKALAPVLDDYDFVVIDCPPSLGLLSLNGLVACTRVVVPVQSEFLALHGVRQLLDTIDQVRSAYNPALGIGGVLLCLHDSRRRLSRTVADTVREYFGELVFTTVVRTNVALAEAPARGVSIFRYDAKSTGAEDYLSLAKEILEDGEEESEV